MSNRKIYSQTGIAIASEASRVLIYKHYKEKQGNKEAISHHLDHFCHSLTIGTKILTANWAEAYIPAPHLKHLQMNGFDIKVSTRVNSLRQVLKKKPVPNITIRNINPYDKTKKLEIEDIEFIFKTPIHGLNLDGYLMFSLFSIVCANCTI